MKNQNLYHSLRKNGYTLIFKEVLYYGKNLIKGNCDAELVLQAMIDFYKYKKAVVVSGDGDFNCLVKYLIKKNKLEKVIIPNKKRYSALLKNGNKGFLTPMNHLKTKLKYMKKAQ